MDAGRRGAGRVPHLRGLVARHLAAHRDFRRPRGPDVDPAEPGRPGGHAGSAFLGAVRAGPRHGRLRTRFLGIGGPARPPDRGDAPVRHRGPRPAGRPAGHGRPGPSPGRAWTRRSRVADVGLARAAGLPPAPVYLAALGPQMLRLAGETADGALLNWATPERIAVSRAADRCGGRAGRPRPGHDPDNHVHPGLHRRRRGRGAAGVRRPRCSATPWPRPASRPARATGACSPRWASGRNSASWSSGVTGARPCPTWWRPLPTRCCRRSATTGQRPGGGRVRPAQRRAGRGDRPDHHGPARPRAGRRGHDRADALPDQGGLAAAARTGGGGIRGWRSGARNPEAQLAGDCPGSPAASWS